MGVCSWTKHVAKYLKMAVDSTEPGVQGAEPPGVPHVCETKMLGLFFPKTEVRVHTQNLSSLALTASELGGC